MKRQFLKLGTCALVVFSVTACNKEKVVNPTIQTQSISTPIKSLDDEQKYDEIIQAISYGFIEIAKNPTLRDLIVTEVDQQFDGDDNVLLKRIDEVFSDKGYSLKALMESSLELNGAKQYASYLDEAIDGFSYFGKVLYPQIYIPFKSDVSIHDIPFIGMSYMEIPDLEETIPAIDITKDNSGSSSPGSGYSLINLNQNTASQKYTWIVSVNEVVDNNGNIPSNPTIPYETMASEYPLGSVGTTFTLHQVKISDLKETWFNGKAEISIVYKKLTSNNTVKAGDNIKTIFKSSQTDVLLDYVASSNVQHNIFSYDISKSTISGSDKMVFIVYERDIRNKFNRTEALISGNSGTNVKYCSKESKYGIVTQFPYNFQSWMTTANEGISNGLTGIEIVLKKDKKVY